MVAAQTPASCTHPVGGPPLPLVLPLNTAHVKKKALMLVSGCVCDLQAVSALLWADALAVRRELGLWALLTRPGLQPRLGGEAWARAGDAGMDQPCLPVSFVQEAWGCGEGQRSVSQRVHPALKEDTGRVPAA